MSIDADAHQESLAAINSWGPKPVLLSYSANGTPLAQSHTFVTRTGAGLHTPSTPALHITVAQPLAANGWTTDSKLLGQLVDEGGISSSKLAKIAMPSKDDDARLKSLQQTFAKHDMLQVVGDPTYLQAMAMPTRVDGITQPALFDITAYSAMNTLRPTAQPVSTTVNGPQPKPGKPINRHWVTATRTSPHTRGRATAIGPYKR